MRPVTTPNKVLEQEHCELEREVADWREWWRELSELGQPCFGEMSDRLQHFRSRLSAHFQHEKLRGPLAGQPGEPVAAIWRDHAQLLRDLDQLIARLQDCGPDACCWGGARREFEEFLDRLHAHELHEARLIGELVERH